MAKQYDRSDSKVEVTGFEARNYDLMMNLITGGTYPFFIRRAIKEMSINPEDRILILGSGTGRNASLMQKYLSAQGEILGLDIGDEMLEQAHHNFRDFPNITFKKQRIDEPLSYKDEFDKVFISFVLHGFIQEDRLKIISNAHHALRPGGKFIILDYNEFDPAESSWLVQSIFKMECPLATDFVLRDWQSTLKENGFDDFQKYPHYFGYVQLLKSSKN
jgi:demethylmenaquinone methyltransferase/2-methoxy-6-polyprenyl-1,4-benzoquinol methylase